MTAEPTPTAAHIDAVAQTIYRAAPFPEWHSWEDMSEAARDDHRDMAEALLDTTDPAVQAALAANLPTDVMLAALTERGELTEEERMWASLIQRRMVTQWEVAP